MFHPVSRRHLPFLTPPLKESAGGFEGELGETISESVSLWANLLVLINPATVSETIGNVVLLVFHYGAVYSETLEGGIALWVLPGSTSLSETGEDWQYIPFYTMGNYSESGNESTPVFTFGGIAASETVGLGDLLTTWSLGNTESETGSDWLWLYIYGLGAGVSESYNDFELLQELAAATVSVSLPIGDLLKTIAPGLSVSESLAGTLIYYSTRYLGMAISESADAFQLLQFLENLNASETYASYILGISPIPGRSISDSLKGSGGFLGKSIHDLVEFTLTVTRELDLNLDVTTQMSLDLDAARTLEFDLTVTQEMEFDLSVTTVMDLESEL